MSLYRTLITASFMLFTTLAAAAAPLDYQALIAQAGRASVSFDTGFEQTYSRTLNLHYAVSVPILEGQFDARTEFEPGPSLPQILFYAPDGRLAEQTGFSSAAIEPGTPDERAAYLANVILEQVVPSLGELQAFQNLGARHARLGPYPAIEMIGIYKDPGLGQIFLRIVGVLAPSGDQAFISITHTINAVVPVSNPNDMPKTFAGTMLESLRFIASRNSEGALVEF